MTTLVKNNSDFKKLNLVSIFEKFFKTIENEDTFSTEEKENALKVMKRLCEMFDKSEQARKFVCHIIITFNDFRDLSKINLSLHSYNLPKSLKFKHSTPKKSAILGLEFEKYIASERSTAIITTEEIAGLILFSGYANHIGISEIVKIYQTKQAIFEKVKAKKEYAKLEIELKKQAQREYNTKHQQILRQPSNQKIAQNLSEKTIDSLVALREQLSNQES